PAPPGAGTPGSSAVSTVERSVVDSTLLQIRTVLSSADQPALCASSVPRAIVAAPVKLSPVLTFALLLAVSAPALKRYAAALIAAPEACVITPRCVWLTFAAVQPSKAPPPKLARTLALGPAKPKLTWLPAAVVGPSTRIGSTSLPRLE